jgi:amino acid permease
MSSPDSGHGYEPKTINETHDPEHGHRRFSAEALAAGGALGTADNELHRNLKGRHMQMIAM